MRYWRRRFTLQYSIVGQALNASNAEINKDFLHENIRGILLAETSGLTSSEFASVLATSGTTGAEGESIGNSWKFSHLVEAFCTQWSDAALAARDAKARKSEAVVAAVDNFDLSELSEAAARIELATISWTDTDLQIVEYEDDDDDNYEEDVDWDAGDCDDELDDTAYTAGTPTDDPELLEQFAGNLEDADASASQVYPSARRSFQEARELLVRVVSARGYFPVNDIGSFDGLAQPSTDRKRVKSRAAKRRQRTRKSAYYMLSSRKESSVNVVSNESTPLVIGLDVLRENGLVIDYHCNCVYSHILKRYLPCAILPTGHLCFGNVAEQQ